MLTLFSTVRESGGSNKAWSHSSRSFVLIFYIPSSFMAMEHCQGVSRAWMKKVIYFAVFRAHYLMTVFMWQWSCHVCEFWDLFRMHVWARLISLLQILLTQVQSCPRDLSVFCRDTQERVYGSSRQLLLFIQTCRPWRAQLYILTLEAQPVLPFDATWPETRQCVFKALPLPGCGFLPVVTIVHVRVVEKVRWTTMNHALRTVPNTQCLVFV